MNTVKTRAALAALVMIAAGSTSACGSNPIKNAIDDAVGNAVGNGVEQVIENAAGEDVDINFDTDGSGASLPDSFPNDIPRPDGNLTMAVATGDGWSLAYAPADYSTVEALVADYGSGWEMQSETDYGEMKIWAFTNDSYFVSVSAIDDGEGWTIGVIAAGVTE
jgi:hypothetical protein